MESPSAAGRRRRIVPARLRLIPFHRRVLPRLGIDDLRLVQHGPAPEPAHVGGRGIVPLVCDAETGQSGTVNALLRKIHALIQAQGPLTVSQYMAIALGDSEHGYYMHGNPFGRDFITSPEVSQMFGEL